MEANIEGLLTTTYREWDQANNGRWIRRLIQEVENGQKRIWKRTFLFNKIANWIWLFWILIECV